MAQGGTRKIVLSPMELTINGVRYEEELIIGGCLFHIIYFPGDLTANQR